MPPAKRSGWPASNRCTSNPATIAPGSSPSTNAAGVTAPASRPPDAIPSLTVGPPIRMTGGAGCNRARLQSTSFDTEGRPPAPDSTATPRTRALLMSALNLAFPRVARLPWRRFAHLKLALARSEAGCHQIESPGTTASTAEATTRKRSGGMVLPLLMLAHTSSTDGNVDGRLRGGSAQPGKPSLRRI